MDFLFDIGNVIVHVDYISSLNRLMPEGIDDPQTRLDRVLERKDEFEAGRITPEDYFPWAAQTLGYTGGMQEFMEAWLDIFSPNNPMFDAIAQLHQAGHRLILFSNINDSHIQYLLNHYPVFQCFSGGVYSFQTGHVKPEQEIYQLAISTYGFTPENTAYIDDLAANIQGGQKAGFICHQYRADGHEAFLEWLNALLEPANP